MGADPDLDQVFTRIEALAAARALPGLSRSTSEDMPALMVGEAAFARLRDAETLVLLCPAEQKALLMEISPQIYFETEHYVGQAAVLVQLAVISDEELSLRLEDAWRFTAPTTLAARRPTTIPEPD